MWTHVSIIVNRQLMKHPFGAPFTDVYTKRTVPFVFTSYETKGRFVNPRSLLKHLNIKSQKSSSHVYKR